MKNSGAVSFGGAPADVYITIITPREESHQRAAQPDTLTPSTGTVTISANTFDSNITINADVIIVKAGTGPNGSVLKTGAATAITLTSTGSPWTSTPPAGYPSDPNLLPAVSIRIRSTRARIRSFPDPAAPRHPQPG